MFRTSIILSLRGHFRYHHSFCRGKRLVLFQETNYDTCKSSGSRDSRSCKSLEPSCQSSLCSLHTGTKLKKSTFEASKGFFASVGERKTKDQPLVTSRSRTVARYRFGTQYFNNNDATHLNEDGLNNLRTLI